MSSSKLLFAALVVCVATTLASAVVQAPASLLLDRNVSERVVDASGTVWQSRIVLAGGLRADLSVQPITSLWRGWLVADGLVTGDQTQLRFDLAARPGAVELSNLSGSINLAALDSTLGGAGVLCSGAAQLEMERVSIKRGAIDLAGEASMPGGQCRRGRQHLEIPALQLVAEGTTARLSTQLGQDLVRIEVKGRQMELSVSQAGAVLFTPNSLRAFTIETEL